MNKIIVAGIAFLLFFMASGCSKGDSLTLRNEQFEISPVGNSGISGIVFIAENLDSTFDVTVKLNQSVKDSVHIMNLYNGNLSNSSTIAVKLNDIRGTGGPAIGETKNIGQLVRPAGNYESTNYDKVLSQSLVIKVFLSASRPDSLIASGMIGL